MRIIIEKATSIIFFVFNKLWTLLEIYTRKPIAQPSTISCEKVKAIIFDHCEVRPPKNNYDVDSLKSSMESLNFEVDMQTVRDWKTINTQTKTMMINNPDSDCYMVVVLTEGMREIEQYYRKVTELVNQMSTIMSTDLVEKPKIVIFQLRNDNLNTDNYQEDYTNQFDEITTNTDDLPKTDLGMPLFANFFLLLSSFSSRRVINYDRTGSPLVNEMAKQLKQHDGKDLYSIFMSVFKEISGLPCYTRCPHYVSTLTHRVCFKKID